MLNEREAEAYLREIQRSGSVLGLESIGALMEELSDVQNQLNIIHVAGTNGKGSVCAMLEAILIEAGYRVGKYTSPGVFVPEERYRINGRNIAREDFTELICQIKEAGDRMQARGLPQPTLFEAETAAAFLYFYQKQCEIVILETGMGGATDATNIIRKSLVSVLTSISRDHMSFLGDTLEEIAQIKAGIIKEGGAVAALFPKKNVQRVLDKVSRERKVPLVYAREEQAENIRLEENRLCFFHKELGEIKLKMMGKYQVKNALCAIEAVKLLNQKGYRVSIEQIKNGLEQAQWEGRFSIVSNDPLFIIDGAHNEEAAKELRKTLEMGFTKYRIIYIIGVLADKEHEKMLQIMLPLAEKVYAVTPHNPRAMEGTALAEEAGKYHQNVTVVSEIRTAVEQAVEESDKEQGMVLAFGSLSYLGEIKSALKEIKVHDR